MLQKISVFRSGETKVKAFVCPISEGAVLCFKIPRLGLSVRLSGSRVDEDEFVALVA
jgi:hypothetical protein